MICGFNAISPSEHTVLAFLYSLMQQHFSQSQMVQTLAGILFFFKLCQFPAFSSYFSVKQALKGYRKAYFVADDRHPISMDILKKLCSSTHLIYFSSYESLIFKISFVVAFFAALRVSKLVPKNKKGGSGLGFNTIVLLPSSANILIKKSKPDQLRKGHWLNLQANICPVKLIPDFIQSRPLGMDIFFLIHEDSSPVTNYL